ncbi:uncharacterized protein PAC_08371 [Phialocephala subalpina]|uniref:BTB domain-containing protein n=1 Tax=Phialocephala subalpina TaxID=576137 RepID=A0A1L7X0D3_9HELO|nr:uncharacterized protein PAC_08371 [Phialocephala subalpina]
MAPSTKVSSRKKKSTSSVALAAKRISNEKPPPALVKSSTIVIVNVRNDDQDEYETFPIHKNYICHHSPYFEAAFNGRFIEGETQEMDIGDVEPMVFGLFVTG